MHLFKNTYCSKCKRSQFQKGGCSKCGSPLVDPPFINKASFVVVFVVIVSWVTISVLNNDSEEPSSAQSQVVYASVGEEGVLDPKSGDEEWLVAVDEEALDALTDASVARDSYGISELLMAHKLFAVPVNTRVKVIDTTATKTKIRVLEGDQMGKDGWVSYEFVIKPN